jgi:hypothetical protein
MSLSRAKPPIWFWIVAGLAVAWNAIGVLAFSADASMTASQIAQLPPEEQEMMISRPSWVRIVYAVAVFGGLLGAAALLIRRSYAIWLFAASLGAIVIQFGYLLFGMNVVDKLGPMAAIFPSVVVMLGVAELWFATFAKGKGWIG